MNKPESIDQSVWSRAVNVYEDLPIIYDGWDEQAVVEAIAQAISLAVKQEREFNAKVADDFYAVNFDKVPEAAECAAYISQAIRFGSKES